MFTLRLLLQIIKPQFVFLIGAIILFYFYNKATPPLQVPDENNHFYRAFQISEGQLFPFKQNNRLGGFIPLSIRDYVLHFEDISINKKFTINEEFINETFNFKYIDSARQFVDFPNTSLYAPVSYAPQAFAMYLFRSLDYSISDQYYAGRIFIVVLWIIFLFIAISLMPFGKWVFTALALLPMNIYITNSFSADVVTNILAVLFISIVLNIAFIKQRFTYTHFVILALLLTLIALAKVVYIAVVILLLVIPKNHFRNKTHYISGIGLLFLVAFLASYIWSCIVMENYTPYVNYNPKFRNGICLSSCANYFLQKQIIVSDYSYFLNVIIRSLSDHPFTYLGSYIGIFGNSDVFLPKKSTEWAYYALLIVALFDFTDKKINLKTKGIFILSAFMSFVLLLLSQHLTWDCVGEGVVDNIQGRYLIPIFPLLFLLLVNNKIKYPIVPPLILLTLLFLIHQLSFKTIYNRYFVDSSYEKTSFYCGAETIDSLNNMLTSNPRIKLAGYECRTQKERYSGAYSVLLSSKYPYSFEYKFKNLMKGDLIEINVMQKGSGGQLIVSGSGLNCGNFYYPYKRVSRYDKNGWGKMRMLVTFVKDCDSSNVTFFAWNPDSSDVYFDNLNFSLRKFKENYVDTGFLRLK